MNYRPGQVARSTKRRGRSDGNGHARLGEYAENCLRPLPGGIGALAAPEFLEWETSVGL